MPSPMRLAEQGWLGRLPCDRCLHDAGARCGMAGAAGCPLLEAVRGGGMPAQFRPLGGTVACSGFEAAFDAPDGDTLH